MGRNQPTFRLPKVRKQYSLPLQLALLNLYNSLDRRALCQQRFLPIRILRPRFPFKEGNRLSPFDHRGPHIDLMPFSMHIPYHLHMMRYGGWSLGDWIALRNAGDKMG